jgi:hypothetical protein
MEQGALPAWHDEGMRVAAALDGVASALVVGRDPEVSAWVALGIARAQAAHRRVAVGDLVGEVAPLRALVAEDDDAHGITDSFLYGVSLNRIARPVDDTGNLFVLPSGSEPVANAEILGSERWRRLAGGFREVGALLLLVAPADAPGLDALAAMLDGVVLAGDASGLLPDAHRRWPWWRRRAPAVVRARSPSRLRPPRAPSRAPRRPWRPSAATTSPRRSPPRRRRTRRRSPSRRRRAPAAPARATAPAGWRSSGRSAVAAAAAWFYLAPRAANRTGSERGDVAPGAVTTAPAGAAGPASAGAATRGDSARAADSVRLAAAARDRVARDSAARADSAAAAGPPVRPGETLPRLAVANPGDSAQALAYAVYVQSSNTPEGALLDARTMTALPPGALTPLLDRGAPWYRLLVGAYGTRAEAEQLLADLRTKRVLGEGSGSIVRAPYALRVADRVPASEAPRQVADLARKNVAATCCRTATAP